MIQLGEILSWDTCTVKALKVLIDLSWLFIICTYWSTILFIFSSWRFTNYRMCDPNIELKTFVSVLCWFLGPPVIPSLLSLPFNKDKQSSATQEDRYSLIKKQRCKKTLLWSNAQHLIHLINHLRWPFIPPHQSMLRTSYLPDIANNIFLLAPNVATPNSLRSLSVSVENVPRSICWVTFVDIMLSLIGFWCVHCFYLMKYLMY